MGKNQSASNLTNIIKQDASGNIVFTSGSTTLATISTAGQLSGSTAVKSATTASYADSFTVTGNLTAQTLVVQTITSSVDFVTGSTRFGSLSSNTHVFTGSMAITGGLNVTAGNVGIGTTNPTTYLDIVNTTGNFVRLITNDATSANNAGIFLYNASSATASDRRSYILLDPNGGNGSGGDYSYFDMIGSGTTKLMNQLSSGTLTLGVGGNSILNITGSNVGIGISSPYSKLDLYGSATNYANSPSVTFTDNTGDVNSNRWIVGNIATDYGSFNIASAPTSTSTTWTPRITILRGGNVGIGTSSPGQILSILSDNTTGTALNIINTSTGGYNWNIFSGGSAATLGQVGSLIFRDSTNGSTKMVITSGGNVGIGLTTPTSNLEIFDNTNSGALSLSRDNGQQRGVIRWGRNNGGTFQNVAQIVGDSDTTSVNNGIFTFWTSNGSGTITERMRITGDGDVLIGRSSNYSGYPDAHVIEKSSGAYALMVRNSNTGDCSSAQFSLAGDPNNTSSYYLICRGGDTAAGANRLLIYGNGNVQNANNSYGQISDISIKKDITPATPKLEDLMKVNIVNFKFIDDKNETKQIGVVAQELEQIFPSMIDVNEDGLKSVKYSVFVPMLVKSIQELNTKLDAANAEIEILKSK